VDTVTIQLEECQLPAARVQEHRWAILRVTRVKTYLLLLTDLINGDINIRIVMDVESGLDGLTQFYLMAKGLLLRTRGRLPDINTNCTFREIINIYSD
jgi:hypothetical protein